MRENLSVVEICAGAGGQSLGLEKAGFQHKVAVELDATAAATLKLNRPNWNVLIGDVADRSVWDPTDFAPANNDGVVDLFAGGVPCPPFSVAGKQLGSDDERDLFAWAVEQVGIIRPRAVMLENVRGLSMPRFAAYRQHVLDRLSELGYRAEWKLLTASDFGLAQLRPRFVLIAMKHEDFEYFHWPAPHAKKVTVGKALKKLMSSNGWEGANSWADAANEVGPTIVGGSKKHGGADLGPTRAKQAWARLGVNGKGIADQAPGPDDVFEIGPKLTLEMVARLQGWNASAFRWSFSGKKTSIYRQIGNAFPPPMAFELGVAISNALKRTAPRADHPALDGVVDPIYKVLRNSTDFLSSEQILREAELDISKDELDARLSILSRDFILERRFEVAGWQFKLGEFKAFVGQENHGRHAFYEESVNKVS